MARKQSYSKFEISSLLDPSSQGYNQSLYDKDIKAIVNAVKSSLPQGAYLSVGNKAIEQDGKLKIDIYTHSSESSFAEKAIDEKLGEMYYKGSSDKRYSVAQSLSAASESKALSKAEKEEHKDSILDSNYILGAYDQFTDENEKKIELNKLNAKIEILNQEHQAKLKEELVKNYPTTSQKNYLTNPNCS